MKTSYLAGIGGALLVAAAIGGGACTYNTTYIIGPDGGMSSSESSASGTGGMMASSSSSMGGAGGAASSNASSSSGPCTTDADGDGAVSWQCPGGTDCADQDFNAHPEPPMVSFGKAPIQGPKAPGTKDYDFNCNGNEEGETLVLKCGMVGCNPQNQIGVQFAVACGGTALLGHCAAITCAWTPENPPKSVVQKCK